MNGASPKHILVVDDEESVRQICSRMLTPLGYVVETVDNADHALARVEKEWFDLLITDYRMPGTLNGLTLGRAVRERSPHTQVMLMTAFPAVDMAVETLRMGGLDYMIKPFDLTELTSRVANCFSRQTPS